MILTRKRLLVDIFLTRRLLKSLAFCEFASINFEPWYNWGWSISELVNFVCALLVEQELVHQTLLVSLAGMMFDACERLVLPGSLLFILNGIAFPSPRISWKRSFPVPCCYSDLKMMESKNSFPLTYLTSGIKIHKFTIFLLGFLIN